MARSCEDLRPNNTSDTDSNPFLFSNFLKKETVVTETAQVWKHFDSSNESVDRAPFPELSTKKDNGRKHFKALCYSAVLYNTGPFSGILDYFVAACLIKHHGFE